jgi:serine/threonine protein kinase
MVGETVGFYKIEGLLWTGGTGQVFVAIHPWIARSVVIKLLLAEHVTSRDRSERFFHGARTLNILRHPAGVEVYDCGVHDGRAYVVMEHLEGESLRAALARVGRFEEDPRAALAIAAAGAEAMAAVHRAGMIHRDLKPNHVFLAPDGADEVRVKLLDFDTALVPGSPLASRKRLDPPGTARYASPEQRRDPDAVDQRSDIYALGCILEEMAGGSSADELIARMLRDDPAERPASMDEVAATLRRLASEAPPPRRRFRIIPQEF